MPEQIPMNPQWEDMNMVIDQIIELIAKLPIELQKELFNMLQEQFSMSEEEEGVSPEEVDWQIASQMASMIA